MSQVAKLVALAKLDLLTLFYAVQSGPSTENGNDGTICKIGRIGKIGTGEEVSKCDK